MLGIGGGGRDGGREEGLKWKMEEMSGASSPVEEAEGEGRGEGAQRVAPPLSAHVQVPLNWLVALRRVDDACVVVVTRGGEGRVGSECRPAWA